MLRRCLAPVFLLPVVATLAVCPSLAFGAAASGTTNYGYYELVNTRSTTLKDLVVTNVIPPNTITPPTPSTSPLTILDGSFGFDSKNLQVFLSPPEPTVQGMAINFANGGLAPGGVLNFKVSLDPSVDPKSPPSLVLQDPDTDLKLIALPNPNLQAVANPPSNTSSGSTSQTPPPSSTTPTTGVENTPEPVSVALWSVLAGAGALRARSFRRSQRAATA